MSLADRLDRLRDQKRQQLLGAVRSGVIAGVQTASALPAPARMVRDAASLFDLLDGCRFEGTGEERVMVRKVAVPLGGGGDCGYTCPMGDVGALCDRERMAALYPGFEELPGGFRPGRIAFVDTETTGLAGGAGMCAFLIAVGWIDEDARAFMCEQYFIEDFAQERRQLELVAERLGDFEAIASYNGKRFDVPLLRARGTLNRLSPATWRLPHADLLYFSRRLWRGAFGSAKLSTIEREVLGITREADIPGAEVPQVWQDFGPAEKLARVLHHNAQDIVSLAALMVRHVEVLCRAEEPQTICHFHEAAGLARWFERRRQWERCRAMYARAVDLAEDAEAEEALLFDHARLCRRMGDWSAAEETWKSLVRRSGVLGVRAGIELAKVAEHRARNHEAALARVLMIRGNLELEQQVAQVTGRRPPAIPERFMEDLDKREARLRRKIATAKKANE